MLDNLSTHTTPEVKTWLEKNPNIQFHFTPVGSSWINQIDHWFGIITRQAIRRGTFSSVKVLIPSGFATNIAHWNSNAEPFVWTATADAHPCQGQARPGQHQEAAGQQCQVIPIESRDTRQNAAVRR